MTSDTLKSRQTAPAIAAEAIAAAPPPAHSFMIAGQRIPAPRAAAGLHLVATPIGNLGDITLRALEVLAGADLIACEDTRVTIRLLERYGIHAPLTAYHEHNAAAARPKLLARLAQGEAIALVSDAGTPLISDPGFKLAREASRADIALHALPGASSVLAALSVAALPTDRFYFEGFLPHKDGARRNRLHEIATIDATLVVFEGGSRITQSIRDLADVLGPREAAICRELTKMHEEVRRGSLADLASLPADEWETRGEFVVIVAPPQPNVLSDSDVDAHLIRALQNNSLKDAVSAVADLSQRPRRDVYARALELTKTGRDA
jgi:16S rRNA (cytidine1402-2'-O)-methyltransferase